MKEQGTSINNADVSASVESVGMLLDNVTRISFQSKFTGAPVGSLKLQVSNDLTENPASVVNWQDYVGSTQAIAATGLYLLEIISINVKWIKIVYTRTSGTGNLTTNFYSILDGGDL